MGAESGGAMLVDGYMELTCDEGRRAVAIRHCGPGDMVAFNWYSADSVQRTRNAISAVLIPD